VEWEKCGVLDKSDNISETRKDRGKVSLWSTYMNTPVTDALSDGTILDPLWPPLPKNWASQPPPKNAIASKLARTFTGSIRTKAHYNFWRKGSVSISRDCPNFFGHPQLSQERVKPRTLNLAGTSTGSIRTKAYYKFWRKGNVGVFRDCPFLG